MYTKEIDENSVALMKLSILNLVVHEHPFKVIVANQHEGWFSNIDCAMATANFRLNIARYLRADQQGARTYAEPTAYVVDARTGEITQLVDYKRENRRYLP